jgi:hypothetical protein
MAQCKNCGKNNMEHSAINRACPGGRKSRTHGYAWFHETQRFEPHQQCRNMKNGVCAKQGPCLHPSCGA